MLTIREAGTCKYDLAALGSVDECAIPEGHALKILTHNVYWFQGYPPRWGEERVAEVPEVLAALTELYRAQAIDLICLQEVHRPELAARLAQELGMAGWLHGAGGIRTEYGGCVLSRQAAQLADRTDTDGHRHERVHLRASLAGHDLVLAAVHLPSNRYLVSAVAGDAARIAELERVVADRPQLVVGDMNCQPDSAPYRFMVEAGYLDAAVLAGRDRMERRIDYTWLEADWRDRFSSFSVLDSGPFRQTAAGERWMLSDHPPLLLELS